ncbi:IS256 family transposase, partial [Clostridium perfringens]
YKDILGIWIGEAESAKFWSSVCNNLKNRGLKCVYRAVTEESAIQKLDILTEKWGDKYGIVTDSWYKNWDKLSTYFEYPFEIRRIIYTTNALEGFNRQLRKYTKNRTVIPTDDSQRNYLKLL